MYYIPGVFSIILLPFLGIWYINSHGYFTKLSGHTFTNIDFAEIEKMTKKYEHVNYGQNEFQNRIYKEVYLNNDKNSKNTFKYINQFVNDVIQSKDTINGLKIHFEEKAIYNEFIEVLNIFNEREAELYILDNNTMYFVGRDWEPKSEESEIDSLPFLICTSGNDYEEVSNFEIFIKNVIQQFNQNKIIYNAYIFLFLLTIVSIILKNKKLPK